MHRSRSLLLLLVVLGGSDALAQAPASRPPATEAPDEDKSIAWIRFRGNRKAEDDAIRLNVSHKIGDKLDEEKLRDDIKAIWKMGYFDDVRVESSDEPGDKIGLTFVVREKPVIRKIYV